MSTGKKPEPQPLLRAPSATLVKLLRAFGEKVFDVIETQAHRLREVDDRPAC